MMKLVQLAGDDSTGGWATNDARNYTRMTLDKIGGPHMDYSEARDGGGFFKGLGSVLKIAAPIAGALIPGVGTLGAMAMGSLGSAAGGALHGDKFNLGKTLMAGGAAAAGNNLLGNGLGGGGTNLGFGSHANLPAGPSAETLNAGTQAAGLPAAPAPSGGPSTLFGKLGGAFQTNGKFDPMKAMSAGAAGLGFMDARKQAAAANKFNNARLQQLQHQSQLAEQDYMARSPMREAAYSRLAQLARQPMGSSIYGGGA
jgi:hypothetical protein